MARFNVLITPLITSSNQITTQEDLASLARSRDKLEKKRASTERKRCAINRYYANLSRPRVAYRTPSVMRYGMSQSFTIRSVRSGFHVIISEGFTICCLCARLYFDGSTICCSSSGHHFSSYYFGSQYIWWGVELGRRVCTETGLVVFSMFTEEEGLHSVLLPRYLP